MNTIDSAENVGLYCGADGDLSVNERERIFRVVERTFFADEKQSAAAEAIRKGLPTITPLDISYYKKIADRSILGWFFFTEASSLQLTLSHVRSELARGEADIVATVNSWRTPLSWQARTVELPTLREWLEHVQRCHEQLEHWRCHEQLPDFVYIQCFSKPHNFVTAFVHDACSTARLALEEHCSYMTLVPGGGLPCSTSKNRGGIVLRSCGMIGAQVSNGVVVEVGDQRSDEAAGSIDVHLTIRRCGNVTLETTGPPSSMSMLLNRRNPVLTIARAASARAVRVSGQKKVESVRATRHIFFTPLYRDRQRSCLVGEVCIPSLEPHQHWILRGAFLCPFQVE